MSCGAARGGAGWAASATSNWTDCHVNDVPAPETLSDIHCLRGVGCVLLNRGPGPDQGDAHTHVDGGGGAGWRRLQPCE